MWNVPASVTAVCNFAGSDTIDCHDVFEPYKFVEHFCCVTCLSFEDYVCWECKTHWKCNEDFLQNKGIKKWHTRGIFLMFWNQYIKDFNKGHNLKGPSKRVVWVKFGSLDEPCIYVCVCVFFTGLKEGRVSVIPYKLITRLRNRWSKVIQNYGCNRSG